MASGYSQELITPQSMRNHPQWELESVFEQSPTRQSYYPVSTKSRAVFSLKYLHDAEMWTDDFQSTESADALLEQTRWFVQARANLQVLRESFAHTPSRDMSPELLGFLIQVMQVSYPRLPFSSAPPSFSLSIA
ncbi:hypothetical protein ECG_09010 [Echinococcus granulosus]|nr:hypothetical protein ECG_09010 [Echinococcus granulosus]